MIMKCFEKRKISFFVLIHGFHVGFPMGTTGPTNCAAPKPTMVVVARQP